MGYTETVCMDCGFIQRECQCNIFNTLGDAVDGEDITEVVCKINEWKSTGTQTDISGKATDSRAQKVVLNLSSGFKLSTSSSGQIITPSYSKPETVMPQPQISSIVSGSLPSIVPSTLMQGTPMYNIPSMVPISTSFNPLQQTTNMPLGFLGGTSGTSLGSIASGPPSSIINVAPSVSQVVPYRRNASQDNRTGTNIKMGNNVLYVPPDASKKSIENPVQSKGKQLTNTTSGSVFKLDSKSGLFMSDDFSLDPKTGKVTRLTDAKNTTEEPEYVPSNVLNENRPKKVTEHVIVKGNQAFIEDDEKLNEEILVKKRKKKRKKKRTVKEILESETKQQNGDSSNMEKVKRDVVEKVEAVDSNNDKSLVEDKENDALGKQQMPDDMEVDQSNVNECEMITENTGNDADDQDNKKKNKDSDFTELGKVDKTNENRSTANAKEGMDEETDRTENDTQDKSKKENDGKGKVSSVGRGSDTEGESDESSSESESSSEGEETDSAEEQENKDEEDNDIHVFDGVRYKVIAPKPHSKAHPKPVQIKVKMPFAEKIKSVSPPTSKPVQKVVIKHPENPTTPGSVLAKCNFSYASSPTTGAPILQHIKKPKLPNTVGTSLNKPTAGGSGKDKPCASGKEKPCFSVLTHNSDNGKGYAKFEFAQTGEKMLRCIIYTCGQVFDTEHFAEIHQSLHQHGTPKELRCKLCNFKGHVLKWYDMLRHLKQTHGSVLKPKILPPKPKKKEDKKEEEEGKKSGKDKEAVSPKDKDTGASENAGDDKDKQSENENETIKSFSQKSENGEKKNDSSVINDGVANTVPSANGSPVKIESGANVANESIQSSNIAKTDTDKSAESINSVKAEGESNDSSTVETKSDVMVNEESTGTGVDDDNTNEVTKDEDTSQNMDSEKKSEETECSEETEKHKKDDSNSSENTRNKAETENSSKDNTNSDEKEQGE